MTDRRAFRIAIAMTISAVAGCTPAEEHARQVSASTGDRLSAGVVQREIREGMTGAEVASILGSPNIVTSNPRGGETWVYDRISTQRAYSQSSGGVNALFLAGVGSQAGASSTSQRTLTVIVQYDTSGHVTDLSYRQSSF